METGAVFSHEFDIKGSVTWNTFFLSFTRADRTRNIPEHFLEICLQSPILHYQTKKI